MRETEKLLKINDLMNEEWVLDDARIFGALMDVRDQIRSLMLKEGYIIKEFDKIIIQASLQQI